MVRWLFPRETRTNLVLVPAMLIHCTNLLVTVNHSSSDASIVLIVVAPGMKVVESANGSVVLPGNEDQSSASASHVHLLY